MAQRIKIAEKAGEAPGTGEGDGGGPLASARAMDAAHRETLRRDAGLQRRRGQPVAAAPPALSQPSARSSTTGRRAARGASIVEGVRFRKGRSRSGRLKTRSLGP